MRSNWEYLSLSDAGISLIDCVHKTPKAKDDGYPYLAIPQIKDGRIDLSSTRKISHEDFLAWTIKAKPKAHDIVLSRRCNPGESAYVPEGVEFALGQNLVLLRSDGKKVYRPYLRWLLNSPFWWAEVRKFMNVGAVFTSLKCADVPNFTLPIPPLDEQMKISKILQSLDKKIELNHQINQTLESISQVIFKSWFVDFEPVKAKIAALESGKDAEGATCAAMRAISGKTDDELDQLQARQPEDYARLKATAELFPEAMQDSELGEVPEGWEVSSVGAEFNATMGQSPPGNTYNENGDGEPFFQGRRDFGWRYPVNRVYCTQPKRMAKKGDTLLSVRAPVGDINKAVSDCCIGRGIAALRHKSRCEAYTYYSTMDLSRNFKSFDSEGTVFGSINQKDLKALKILKPPNSLVEIFTHTVGTLDQQILNFDYQIRVLSKLRDILLPKLMSGKIRVTNIR